MRRRRTSLAPVAALLLLIPQAAGCGQQAGPGSDEPTTLTARAVAAVMLEHLGDDTTSSRATTVDETSPEGLVGAELRYGGDGESDGDMVEVRVMPRDSVPEDEQGMLTCEAGSEDPCADLGGGAVLHWDPETPEEDPGIYSVGLVTDDEVVRVVAVGPHITGDPRTLSLDPSVDDLVELVSDERLRLTTTAAAVQAGEDLGDWDGGEVDPTDLEEVPHSDASLSAGWIDPYGDDFVYVGPSPVKSVLGDGAIGGRLEVGKEIMPVGPGTIDVLAAPAAPDWLEGECLPEMTCHRFQGTTFAFRPAEGDDPGEAWLVAVHDDGEAVALRTVGRRLPAAWREAVAEAGGWMWASDLTGTGEEGRLGMTTSARIKKMGEEAAQAHPAR